MSTKDLDLITEMAETSPCQSTYKGSFVWDLFGAKNNTSQLYTDWLILVNKADSYKSKAILSTYWIKSAVVNS